MTPGSAPVRPPVQAAGPRPADPDPLLAGVLALPSAAALPAAELLAAEVPALPEPLQPLTASSPARISGTSAGAALVLTVI